MDAAQDGDVKTYAIMGLTTGNFGIRTFSIPIPDYTTLLGLWPANTEERIGYIIEEILKCGCYSGSDSFQIVSMSVWGKKKSEKNWYACNLFI